MHPTPHANTVLSMPSTTSGGFLLEAMQVSPSQRINLRTLFDKEAADLASRFDLQPGRDNLYLSKSALAEVERCEYAAISRRVFTPSIALIKGDVAHQVFQAASDLDAKGVGHDFDANGSVIAGLRDWRDNKGAKALLAALTPDEKKGLINEIEDTVTRGRANLHLPGGDVPTTWETARTVTFAGGRVVMSGRTDVEVRKWGRALLLELKTGNSEPAGQMFEAWFYAVLATLDHKSEMPHRTAVMNLGSGSVAVELVTVAGIQDAMYEIIARATKICALRKGHVEPEKACALDWCHGCNAMAEAA